MAPTASCPTESVSIIHGGGLGLLSLEVFAYAAIGDWDMWEPTYLFGFEGYNGNILHLETECSIVFKGCCIDPVLKP